jgi:pimeloyl-ACP methyl ester carboxylesterase
MTSLATTRMHLALIMLLGLSASADATEGILERLQVERLHVERKDAPQVSSDGVWTDVIIDGGWRIQRHAIFGYLRLLDPQERRLVFGDMQQCYGELQRWRSRGEVAPMSSHVVICLHGWRGSRASMQDMSRFLTEQGGLSVINFGYASTHGTVQQQAYALESVLRNLQGVQRVSFVAHSLGNIVVRQLLYKLQVQGNLPPLSFERMVMISPPNHGAELANTVARRRLLRLMFGEAIDQLAPQDGWPALEQQLAVPNFEFGIMAGGRGNDVGYLPRVPGDDDGLLSIKTQRLEGSAEFLQFGGLHQFMPKYRAVQTATLAFLQHGKN